MSNALGEVILLSKSTQNIIIHGKCQASILKKIMTINDVKRGFDAISALKRPSTCICLSMFYSAI